MHQFETARARGAQKAQIAAQGGRHGFDVRRGRASKLNRAVAIAMRDGPEAGIAQTTPMLSTPPLASYHLTHAAHADLCRRAGRLSEARASYARALALAEQEPERRFLRRRLAQLGT